MVEHNLRLLEVHGLPSHASHAMDFLERVQKKNSSTTSRPRRIPIPSVVAGWHGKYLAEGILLCQPGVLWRSQDGKTSSELQQNRTARNGMV